MLTRGAKTFFGLAFAALLGGIVYGVITNGFAHDGVATVLTGDGAVDAVLGPITLGYKGGVGDQLGYSLFMGFAVSAFGMGFAALAFRADTILVDMLAKAQEQPDECCADAAGEGHHQRFKPGEAIARAQRRGIVKQNGQRGMIRAGCFKMNVSCGALQGDDDVFHAACSCFR